MRAAMIDYERKIGITQIPMPEADGTNVIIKLTAAGINGYDTALWELGNLTKETVPGHEMIGVVVDPGSRSDLKEGDRVTVLPLAACMECEFCKSGRENECLKNRNTPGKSKVAFGCFAEYFSARPEFVKKVPDKLSDFEALMLVPAATAYHMVKSMNVQKGWKVLITGGGIMGSLIAMWCRYFEAKYIGVVEQNKYRGLLMMDHGAATRIFDAADPDIVNTLIDAARGFHVHFECSGTARYINTGILSSRRGATIATLSLYQKSVPVNFYMMQSKLIKIRPFNAHAISDFDEAVEIIMNNYKKFNFKRFEYTPVALDDIQEMMETLTTEDHKLEKVVINKF